MGKRFQLANPLWWVIIPGAFLFGFLLSYYPNVLPLGQLGRLEDFLLNLVSDYRTVLVVAFWVTILAHVYEALIARRICQKLKLDQQSTLLWTIQTFVLGYPSLKLLKGLNRQRK